MPETSQDAGTAAKEKMSLDKILAFAKEMIASAGDDEALKGIGRLFKWLTSRQIDANARINALENNLKEIGAALGEALKMIETLATEVRRGPPSVPHEPQPPTGGEEPGDVAQGGDQTPGDPEGEGVVESEPPPRPPIPIRPAAPGAKPGSKPPGGKASAKPGKPGGAA